VKIGIFSRTGFHHTSFINRLQEEFETLFVVREAYPEKSRFEHMVAFCRKLLRRNSGKLFLEQFSLRYSAGFRDYPGLGTYLSSPFDVVLYKTLTKYLDVSCGEINSIELRNYLQRFKPDIIAVLGSSIIGQEMISMPRTAMINIHSGLSPYYRGTWSFGWPVVNMEPEFIGVTIHHVNAGIDTGDIIYQTKPLLEPEDDLNTIFLKVIREGIELMVKAIGEISTNGSVLSHRQPPETGRFYKTKDLDEDSARICLRNLENGIIGEYLSNREERDKAVRLFGYIPPVVYR
jgi:hypothetical protein